MDQVFLFHRSGGYCNQFEATEEGPYVGDIEGPHLTDGRGSL